MRCRIRGVDMRSLAYLYVERMIGAALRRSHWVNAASPILEKRARNIGRNMLLDTQWFDPLTVVPGTIKHLPNPLRREFLLHELDDVEDLMRLHDNPDIAAITAS